MKGFHHPNGSQVEFLNAIGILHNLIPYQRRAKNTGLCGIQVDVVLLKAEKFSLKIGF